MPRDDTDRMRDGDLPADPFEDTEPMPPPADAVADLRAEVDRLESDLKARRSLLASVDGTAGETKPPTVADAVDAFLEHEWKPGHRRQIVEGLLRDDWERLDFLLWLCHLLDDSQLDPRYDLERAQQKQREAEEELSKATEDPPKCKDCGTTERIAWGPCPYAYDIGGDDTPHWICDHCRAEAAADI